MFKSFVNVINIIYQLIVKGDCVWIFVYLVIIEFNYFKVEGKFGFI